jgi:hypothetical protein
MPLETDKLMTNRVTAATLRSLFPITALTVILGTMWWGPWISLGITLAWWRIVARIG